MNKEQLKKKKKDDEIEHSDDKMIHEPPNPENLHDMNEIDPTAPQSLIQQLCMGGQVKGYADGGEVQPDPNQQPEPELSSWDKAKQWYMQNVLGTGVNAAKSMLTNPGQVLTNPLGMISDANEKASNDFSTTPAQPQIAEGTPGTEGPNPNIFQTLSARVSGKVPPTKPAAQEQPEPTPQPETAEKPVDSGTEDQPANDLAQKAAPMQAGNDAGSLMAEYMKMFQNAKQATNENQLGANLQKAYQQTLAAAGRTRPDYSMADSLEKQASQPLEQLQSQMKLSDAAQKMEYNKQIADPNSSISKLFQNLATKYVKDPASVQGVSAQGLSKILPSLIGAVSKEDIANIKGTLAGKKTEQHTAEQNEKFIGQARNEVLKHRKDFDEINKAKNMLEEGIRNPNAINDIASFYASAKAFNPKAIVRSQSVKLEQQALGPWTKLENQINALTTGKVRLSDTKVQQEMLNSINQLHKIALEDQNEYQNAVLRQAKDRGISEGRFDQIVPGYGGKSTANAAGQNPAQPNQAKPKTVTQNGHTYKLNEQTGEYE